MQLLLPASNAAALCQVKQKKVSLDISNITASVIPEIHYPLSLHIHDVCARCNL